MVILDGLRSLSRELADLRGPAFYQEIALREDQARVAVDGAEKVGDTDEGAGHRGIGARGEPRATFISSDRVGPIYIRIQKPVAYPLVYRQRRIADQIPRVTSRTRRPV